MSNISLTHEKECLELMAIELFRMININLKPSDVSLVSVERNNQFNPHSLMGSKESRGDSYIISYRIIRGDDTSTVSYMVCENAKNMVYYSDEAGVELGGAYPYENARIYFKKKEDESKQNLMIEGILKGYQAKPTARVVAYSGKLFPDSKLQIQP